MVFRKKVWRRRASFSLGCFALIGVVVLSAKTLVATRKKNPCSDLYKPRSVLNLITFVRENKVDAELLRTILWNNFAQLGNFDKILSRANSWTVVGSLGVLGCLRDAEFTRHPRNSSVPSWHNFIYCQTSMKFNQRTELFRAYERF